MLSSVLLTDDEIRRCTMALTKLPADDLRARYLSWRLTSGAPKSLKKAPKIPVQKHTMAPSLAYRTCVANLKNRDVLQWLDLDLPTVPIFSKTWSAGISLNKLSKEVSKGMASLDRLTVYVLRAQAVMQMTELLRFEDAPAFQVYVTNLMDRNIHFISHKWYGDRPDSADNSVLKYVKDLIKIGTKNGLKGIDEDDLVWIDYCCVPQLDKERKMRELVKIPYLLNYSAVHIFAEHPDYDRSVWCRLEQTVNASIGPCRDLTDFWIQDKRDLMVLLPSLIQLDVARMKIRAFGQLEPDRGMQGNEIVRVHPNYFKLDYLVPNNILLEMILYSIEC
jgi:hypothetical protein